MGRTVGHIVEALEQKYPQGLPTDEAVRSQSFEYIPRHWTDRWPSDLDTPDALKSSERKRVSRSDLFAQARNISSDEAILDLYVGICGWGTGTKAQRVARCVKPLYQHGAVAALGRAYEAAQSQNPVAAYKRLNTWSEDRIKYLGPSFFTKWLYFSAYDASQSTQVDKPLILDAHVASAMGWKAAGWGSSDYGRYLETVAQVREAWRHPTEPHVIEYALFQLGRADAASA